ncbi:MAG: hypothetical protein RM338_12465 [Nostoc sp. DedQUE12a]|nr:hypothetical protein [Nostoc sp. DedQUE12a]
MDLADAIHHTNEVWARLEGLKTAVEEHKKQGVILYDFSAGDYVAYLFKGQKKQDTITKQINDGFYLLDNGDIVSESQIIVRIV